MGGPMRIAVTLVLALQALAAVAEQSTDSTGDYSIVHPGERYRISEMARTFQAVPTGNGKALFSFNVAGGEARSTATHGLAPKNGRQFYAIPGRTTKTIDERWARDVSRSMQNLPHVPND